MSEARHVERREDMSPTGRLRLILQPDGDVIVVIVPDLESQSVQMGFNPSVEFCAYSGGGRSRHTLEALRALAEAIERDNAETPLSPPGGW